MGAYTHDRGIPQGRDLTTLATLLHYVYDL